MANQKHLNLLKQGVGQWNEWREHHLEIRPDLRDASLANADLSGANLRLSNLNGTNLHLVDLAHANLSEASLICANLSEASLIRVSLSGANLFNADLSGANLFDADLSNANLRDANLWRALVDGTVFAHVDLRSIKGLTELRHRAPSRIELHTIQLPQDGSASHFLRGAGVPDEWINDYHAHMMHPVQYHSLFISYSSKDEPLARRLHADLQANGVRCWFAPEDLKIGDRFHSRIDEAIHIHDKLLLLLSEGAIQSDWVEIEVRSALEKEQRQHRDVLFPVCLDSSVMETSQAWAAMLRQSRHIGDFINWTDLQAYQLAFTRLLDDLKKTEERQNQEIKP